MDWTTATELSLRGRNDKEQNMRAEFSECCLNDLESADTQKIKSHQVMYFVELIVPFYMN